MKRMLLLLGTMSSLIVFFIVTSNGPGFGEENAAMTKKEIKMKMVFTEGEWGPEDKGNKGEDDKWVPISKDDPEFPKESNRIYHTKNNEVEVYKVNPCVVCMGGQCYVKKNC